MQKRLDNKKKHETKNCQQNWGVDLDEASDTYFKTYFITNF